MAMEQDDFVDKVAQAVIDKIEERDRIAGLVEQIALRVIAIQKRDAELAQQNADAQTPTDSGDSSSDSSNARTD